MSTRIIVALTAALVLVSALQIIAMSTRSHPLIVAAAKKSAQNVDEPVDETSTVRGKWYGLCGKNQIRSIEHFHRLVEQDRVLAKHYAGFNWKLAREEVLNRPTLVYVAYRKNQQIKYTTRRVKLPKGDRYITDTKRNARFFCGNDFIGAPPNSPPESPGPSPVPEPATAVLASIGSAVLGLTAYCRRRRSR